MSDAGRPRADSPSIRLRLLSGVPALVLLACAAAATPVAAQTDSPPPASPPAALSLASDTPPHPADRAVHGQVGPDGLSHDEMYLEADSVTQDQTNHMLSAHGSVVARYQDRTLRAQEVIYNTETGLITANGQAQIISPDGTVQYAEHMELDDKLHAGVATGFAAREAQNVKIAAASAVRRSDTVNELNHAIFTPCEICTESGKPKTPSWSIQADKIVQDKARKLVFYRHAIVRIKGIPVLYTPILWHPDPSAPRASGLLIPRVSFSQRRGASYEQPFLWVISPSQDLEVTPQFNTKLNPFVNLDWRKRFWSGAIEGRVGYTYEADSDSRGRRFDQATSRSFVLANGAFDLTREWRWGFSAERTSDPTIFDRYDIPNVYDKRGLFDDDVRRLTSQLYLIRQDERSFVSLAAISLQSYRPWIDPVTGFGFRDPRCTSAHPGSAQDCPLLVENNGALPLIAPLVEARYEPDTSVFGGRLRLLGSAVALTRDDASLARCAPLALATPANPPPACTPLPHAPGIDSRRVTGQLDWRSSFITGGLRFDPFVIARGDAYNLGNLPGPKRSQSIARGFATAGVDLTYPLVRRFGDGSILVEPIAQFAISPRANLDPHIPNQDSYSFSVDETSLFRQDKFTGFDIYEGGARLNTGVRATVDLADGRWGWLLLGRSFRSSQAYPYAPGINAALKTWVVAAEVAPFKGLTAFGRADVNDRAQISRAEAGINWDFARSHGLLRYFRSNGSPFTDPTDPFTINNQAHDVEAAGDVLITRHWGAVFDVTRDLESRPNAKYGLWRRSEVGVLYQDDCLRMEVVYHRNESGLLRRTDAVFLRLSLATLGDTGYRRYDNR